MPPVTAKAKSPVPNASGSAKVTLGKCLRSWRKSQGFPLKRVARDFGVAEATWDRWEKGTRFPMAENLRLLAEFIGAPVCSFFYPDGPACPVCQYPPPRGRKH